MGQKKKHTMEYSNNWEFYTANVNDDFASIRVDAKAHELREEYSHTLYIRIPYEMDEETGFPVPEARQWLMDQEDILSERLKEMDIYQVGTITAGGCFDLAYVTRDIVPWEQLVHEILQNDAVMAGLFENDRFSYYDDCLYPQKLDFNQIFDRKVCMNLESSGDDMTTPRTVDFFANFKEDCGAKAFIKGLDSSFDVTDKRHEEGDDVSVSFTRKMVPLFREINLLTTQLFDLANKNNGDFNGWGTTIEKETY